MPHLGTPQDGRRRSQFLYTCLQPNVTATALLLRCHSHQQAREVQPLPHPHTPPATGLAAVPARVPPAPARPKSARQSAPLPPCTPCVCAAWARPSAYVTGPAKGGSSQGMINPPAAAAVGPACWPCPPSCGRCRLLLLLLRPAPRSKACTQLLPLRHTCASAMKMMSWSCSHSSVQAPTSSASISSSPARCPMSSARTPRSPSPAWCHRNVRTQALSAARGSHAAAGSLYPPEPAAVPHTCFSTGRLSRPPPPSAARPPEAPHRQPVELSAVTSRPQPSEKARSGGSCTTSQLMCTERGTPHRGRRALMAAQVWRWSEAGSCLTPAQLGRQAC